MLDATLLKDDEDEDDDDGDDVMMFIMMMTVQTKQVVSETTMMHFHMPDVQNHCFAIAAWLFSIHIMNIFTTAAKWS